MRIRSVSTRLAATAIAAIAAVAGGHAAAADLTVTAYGGAWEQAYRKCFIQPFEKETGKKVDVVLGTPTQWINQIAANPAKPPIDVMIGSVDSGKVARDRGLVDKITPAEVPNVVEIGPKLLEYGAGYGFPITFGDFGLMYNNKTTKELPKTWKEFVDGTVAGKWQVGLPGIAYNGTTQGLIGLFAQVFGGSLENVQPGLDQIKRMRDSGNVRWFNDANTPLTWIRNGEVDMAMYFDGRAWTAHDDGNPMIGYTSPKPGSVGWPNMAQKVKNGSPLGYKFLDVLASREGQACFANSIQFAASNKNVVYDPKIKPRVATEAGSLWISFDKVAELTPTWIEMWNKQIGR